MERRSRSETLALIARYARRRWKPPLLALAGALVLLFFFTFTVGGDDQPEPPVTQQPAVESGYVASLYAKSVGSPFDGRVTAVPVREGERVRRGELLFSMDTRLLEQQLAAAEAAAARAEAELRELRERREADLAPFRREVTGLEELEWRLGQAREALRQRQQVWEPYLSRADRQVSTARGRAAELRRTIRQAKRVSPVDGIVTQVSARPGEWIRAYEPIVRIDNPDGYRIVTLVGEDRRDAFQAGTSVRLRGPSGTIPGRLEKVERGEGRELFRYWVWVKPERVDHLQPGAAVEIVFPTEAPVPRPDAVRHARRRTPAGERGSSPAPLPSV